MIQKTELKIEFQSERPFWLCFAYSSQMIHDNIHHERQLHETQSEPCQFSLQNIKLKGGINIMCAILLYEYEIVRYVWSTKI